LLSLSPTILEVAFLQII